jgi:hypothetical protein
MISKTAKKGTVNTLRAAQVHMRMNGGPTKKSGGVFNWKLNSRGALIRNVSIATGDKWDILMLLP